MKFAPWILLVLPCPCLAQHRLLELVAWDHPNEYGSSVAINSGRAVVGASGDSVNGSASGSAYFFDFTGALALKVTPSDANKSDRFGWSVAVKALGDS